MLYTNCSLLRLFELYHRTTVRCKKVDVQGFRFLRSPRNHGLRTPREEIVELVSKELNHFVVIADLFRQIGVHCTILLFLKTLQNKNDKKCKSISIFFLKNNNKKFFFYFIKFKPPP